jgi:hypothetical protein
VVSCVVSAPEPINASQASEAITAEENKPKKSTGERTGNRDCKEIKLPETPNAFRAILQAGDPNVIEPPPYTLIDARTKEEITIYDVNKLRIVQEDDKVCVDP